MDVELGTTDAGTKASAFARRFESAFVVEAVFVKWPPNRLPDEVVGCGTLFSEVSRDR